MDRVSSSVAARPEPVTVATWVGFLAMCLGMFMAILDIQVVASSLTDIADALGIEPERLSWIQTGYLMAEVVAIPLTGWLTRALSLRWMFVIATAGFTLASLGCAFANALAPLITIRVFQGFCGGMLIPAVFTSVFTMFPKNGRVLATTIAGTFAVIAPTIGPGLGGYLTQTYSWHWIFLVNILPGIAVALTVASFIRVGAPDWRQLKRIDYATLLLTALFLASLELVLKEGPTHEWQGRLIISLFIVCPLAALAAVYLCLHRTDPFLDLRRFRDSAFSAGCALSFVLGIGLYGSVYLMALFLGQVRNHLPLEIGEIMMVSGAAQLATAPIAAIAEKRFNPKLLTALGFGLFALGLWVNGASTVRSDFSDLLLPQILRGCAVLFCLLPATRLALDGWPEAQLAEASGVFNLMRNLGGAIGIAVVDTILLQRTPGHIERIVSRLQAGDRATAQDVGLPLGRFHGVPLGPIDDMTRTLIAPLVRRAALTHSFNEAWVGIAALFALAVIAIPFIPGMREGRNMRAL
jgi:DHA2 family multidrug resistance protein